MQKDKLMKKLIARAKAEQASRPKPIAKPKPVVQVESIVQVESSTYAFDPSYRKEVDEALELQSIFSNFKGKFK